MCLATMFFMVFGWFIILGVILISILVLGITLLVIGIVTRKRNDKKGIAKKYPKVCTIIGSVLTVISLVILGAFLVSYMIDAKKGEYNPDTYDPHTSTMIQDDEYCKEIIQEVIRCLDEEDTEGLKEMFSKYSMELTDLDSQIEEAMKIYEGESLECNEFSCGENSAHVEYGYYHYKSCYVKFRSVCTNTGDEYYITVDICLVSKEESKEGIMLIEIKDPNNQNETLIRIGKYY